MPAGTISYQLYSSYIAMKDIRIWNEAMPIAFLNQLQLKELEGSYYPMLIYYMPQRYQLDLRHYSRKYFSGVLSI